MQRFFCIHIPNKSILFGRTGNPPTINYCSIIASQFGQTERAKIRYRSCMQCSVEQFHVLSLWALKEKYTATIEIFSKDIGNINLADGEKALEFNLVIIGFNTKIDNDCKAFIKNKNIKSINENIIYRILEEVELLTIKNEIIEVETLVGTCEIRHLFTFNNIVIAGSRVLTESIFHSIEHTCEVFRKDKSIFKGTISSMKKDKENVKEGKVGTDVGVIFDNFNKVEIKDIIKCYKITKETVNKNE